MYESFFKNKRVLVTGGSGLIGSSLWRELYSLGAKVSAPEHAKIDYTKKNDIIKAIKGKEIIFHCAAKSAGAKIMNEDPKQLITDNIIMTALLLHYAQEAKVERFIYISSTTVNYPEDYQGIAQMKRFGEELCLFYKKRYGLNCHIIRPCNVYGPHDKFEEDRSHFIPALIKRAVKKEEPFMVWGTGENSRNLIYVDDLIEGILETVESNDYRIMTIGSSKNFTIREIVDIILELTEHNVKPEYDTTKPDTIKDNIPEVNLIKDKIHIKEGLKKTIEWYKGKNEI